ncbi:hypothetical protein FZEAL_8220 [Fusarium zealandicum]|uniref:Uncharacterized protein n=1 Tax=Fusarium zealandicum TaxID=1053134 RepID=A0A8H4XH19_9HYPO|nr:hypothetical protein FZEAL_8220 [Fusarium zealandicum]
MLASNIIATLAVLVPFAAAQCLQRTKPCSPAYVCDRVSGNSVCGTTESASACRTTLVVEEDRGAVTCHCCKR